MKYLVQYVLLLSISYNKKRGEGTSWNNFTKLIFFIVWIVWLTISSTCTLRSTTFCATAWNFLKNVIEYWWHFTECWDIFPFFSSTHTYISGERMFAPSVIVVDERCQGNAGQPLLKLEEDVLMTMK